VQKQTCHGELSKTLTFTWSLVKKDNCDCKKGWPIRSPLQPCAVLKEILQFDFFTTTDVKSIHNLLLS